MRSDTAGGRGGTWIWDQEGCCPRGCHEGPGGMLTRLRGTRRGVPPGGSTRGHCSARGSGSEVPGKWLGETWRQETCPPALGCVALRKLLPSFIGPRGDAEQLLIKTDASEAVAPSPDRSHPRDSRATEVPGATSAVPQHPTAPPQPLHGAIELPHKQRGEFLGWFGVVWRG